MKGQFKHKLHTLKANNQKMLFKIAIRKSIQSKVYWDLFLPCHVTHSILPQSLFLILTNPNCLNEIKYF